MSSFRKERAKQRKLEILRKAAEIFNEKGYQGTTIEEIANQLKFTKASLYHYIENKEDLLFQCHEMVAETSISYLLEISKSKLTPKDKMRKAIETHIKHICEEKSMFNVVVRPSDITSDNVRNEIIRKRDIYESLFLDILIEGINTGHFRNNNPKITLLLILGSLNSIAQWYSPTRGKTQDEIGEIFTSNILAMLESK